MSTIENGYQGFAASIEAKTPETRQGFFAGAMFMMATLSEINMEDDDEVVDAQISELRDELIQFRNSIGH